MNEIQAGRSADAALGLAIRQLEQKPSEGGIYSETNINSELVGRFGRADPRRRSTMPCAAQG